MDKIQTKRKKLDEYYHKIETYLYTNINAMKEQAEMLLNYSYKIDDDYAKAYAHLYLSVYYSNRYKMDSAKFHLYKAKHLCETQDYRDLLLRCYHNEGILYQLSGDRFQAVQLYGEELSLAEEADKEDAQGIIFNNIAVILMNYMDFELAKEYFEKAVSKFSGLKNMNIYLMHVYINLVLVCCEINDVESAELYFNKTNSIETDIENLGLLRKSAELRLYAQKNEKNKAVFAYEEFMHMIDEQNVDLGNLVPSILQNANSMLLLNIKDKCLDMLQKADASITKNDMESMKQLHKLHVDYYEKYEDNYADAYEEYYQFLTYCENKEYDNLAKSLQSKMELFEKNQKHSVLLEENENLQNQAHLDELTTLYNHRYFNKLLTKLETDTSIQTIGCIMIDVDFFKEYNDTYGHIEGDQVLRFIGSSLKAYEGEGFYAGRYGGDEFYCLCTNVEESGIIQYLENVYKRIRNDKIEHCKSLCGYVSISAGYHIIYEHEKDVEFLIRCADEALYKAKEKGRNTFISYSQKN